MPRQEYDTLFMRFPKQHGWGAVLDTIAARHKAAGHADLASKTAIGQMIVGVFLKTAAYCRANPEIDPYKMMGVNFAALYHQLFREGSNDHGQETGV